MAKQKTKTKIYNKRVNIGILVLIVLLCITAHLTCATFQAKADVNTRKAAGTISNQIYTYIDKNHTVPTYLGEVTSGKIPSTIKYQKIDNERFRICAIFHRANNPSVGKLQQFVNLIHIDTTALTEDKVLEYPYYGVVSIDDYHLAGPDCYNVHYYKFS